MSDIPSRITERYGSKQVQSCFDENKSPYVPFSAKLFIERKLTSCEIDKEWRKERRK